MNVIEARKILVKVDNHLTYIDNTLSKELINDIKEISTFINNNLLDNLSDIFNNHNFNNIEVLKIISQSLTKEDIYKILKSNKLRDIFNNDEVLILWNKLSNTDKVNYLLNSNYIHKRDNFLVIKLLNDKLITLEDIKDLITKNSLDIELTNLKDFTSYYKLITSNNISNFINNNYTVVKHLLSNKDLLNLIKNNSLVLKCNLDTIKDDFNSTKLLEKLNYYQISKIYNKTKILELYETSKSNTLLSALYLKDRVSFTKILNKEFLNLPDHYLLNDSYNLINNKNIFIKNPLLLFKYDNEVIKDIIKDNYKDDDIIDLLRNNDFINTIDSNLLIDIISNLQFNKVFNILQNDLIYNKVHNLKFNITSNDKSLIIGFLDSYKLCKKIDSSMYYLLLNYLNYDEIITYITKPYILNNLKDHELVELLCIKNISIINLMNNKLIVKRLNKNLLINYINKMWLLNFDINLISNKLILKTIFDLSENDLKNIKIEDVNYLFETLITKENLSNNKSILSVLSYKAVLISYMLFGISNTLDILCHSTKKLNMKDITKYEEIYINNKLNKYFINDGIYLNDLNTKLKDILLSYKEINKDIITNNKYLNHIVKLILNINIDLNTIIKKFNRFINYYPINNIIALSELNEFTNLIVNTYTDNLTTIYKQEYICKINKFINLKDNIYKDKLKEKNKNVLTQIKLKLLYSILKDNKSYKSLFRKNVNGPEKIKSFKKYLLNLNIGINDYLDNIILPLSDNIFNIDNYLLSKEIIKPDNYSEYINILNNNSLIDELNNKFLKLSYKLNHQELLNIADYLLYNNKYQINKNLVKDLNICKYLISKITIEINYDSVNNQFIINNLINSYQDSRCITYHKYYEEIETLINNTLKFIKNNFINKTIYKYYYDKFDITNNNDLLSSNLKDYHIKETIFNINDLEQVLAGINIKDIKDIDSNYLDELINHNLFPFIFSDIIPFNYDNTLINNIFNTHNINYYEVINNEDILNIYHKCFKNNKKYLLNINYQIDNNYIKDISGYTAIKTLINYNNKYHEIINLKEILNKISNKEITIYTINNQDIFYSEVIGNKLIIKSLRPSDIFTIFGENILNDYPYLDYIYLDNKLIVSRNNYQDIINTYYGEALPLPNNKYNLKKEYISNNLLNILKLNYELNNQDTSDFDNFKEIEFDNYKVKITK